VESDDCRADQDDRGRQACQSLDSVQHQPTVQELSADGKGRARWSDWPPNMNIPELEEAA
jgi:hypothetical protein